MEPGEHFAREVVSVYGGRLVIYTMRHGSLSRYSQNADDICGVGHNMTDTEVVGWKVMLVYGGCLGLCNKSDVGIWSQVSI